MDHRNLNKLIGSGTKVSFRKHFHSGGSQFTTLSGLFHDLWEKFFKSYTHTLQRCGLGTRLLTTNTLQRCGLGTRLLTTNTLQRCGLGTRLLTTNTLQRCGLGTRLLTINTLLFKLFVFHAQQFNSLDVGIVVSADGTARVNHNGEQLIHKRTLQGTQRY